jgi:hypothetical protein
MTFSFLISRLFFSLMKMKQREPNLFSDENEPRDTSVTGVQRTNVYFCHLKKVFGENGVSILSRSAGRKLCHESEVPVTRTV